MPGPDAIADPQHARLFNTAFLRATNRTAFEQKVIAWVRALQQAAETARADEGVKPATGRTHIFVDDLAGEPALNERLRALLRGANCDVRGLPPQAPLANNGIDIAQVLKPCRAGITLFADPAKQDTVYNRLIFFLDQIAESRLPVARWGIYVTAETKGCDLGLASDDLLTIDELGLAEFVRRLER